MKISLSLLLIVLSLFSQPSLAFTLSRADAENMLLQCRAMRADRIEPLKQEEIKHCIEKGKDKAACERYNATFGETTHINGKVMPGLFWEEPICQQALKAEKFFKKNPHKKTMPLY